MYCEIKFYKIDPENIDFIRKNYQWHSYFLFLQDEERPAGYYSFTVAMQIALLTETNSVPVDQELEFGPIYDTLKNSIPKNKTSNPSAFERHYKLLLKKGRTEETKSLRA